MFYNTCTVPIHSLVGFLRRDTLLSSTLPATSSRHCSEFNIYIYCFIGSSRHSGTIIWLTINEMDFSSINLFDDIDILQRSLFGRTALGMLPGSAVSQNGPADVFIVKTALSGLEDSEKYSDTSQLIWLRRIWRCVKRKVTTNSRTTHWAAEIRGDLYETFRHKEYYLPWEWKATILITVEEDVKKQPQRKVVERLHVGTTVLSNAEIASRCKINPSFGQEIAAN